MYILANWGLGRSFVFGETDATCGQPVSSIDSLALISTRSGTKLESTALHTFSLGSKRPRQVFNASLSAGGLKCLFQKLVTRIWLFVWKTEDTLHNCCIWYNCKNNT